MDKFLSLHFSYYRLLTTRWKSSLGRTSLTFFYNLIEMFLNQRPLLLRSQLMEGSFDKISLFILTAWWEVPSRIKNPLTVLKTFWKCSFFKTSITILTTGWEVPSTIKTPLTVLSTFWEWFFFKISPIILKTWLKTSLEKTSRTILRPWRWS